MSTDANTGEVHKVNVFFEKIPFVTNANTWDVKKWSYNIMQIGSQDNLIAPDFLETATAQQQIFFSVAATLLPSLYAYRKRDRNTVCGGKGLTTYWLKFSRLGIWGEAPWWPWEDRAAIVG